MSNLKNNEMKHSKKLVLSFIALTVAFGMQSCKKDDVEPTPTPAPAMMTSTYNYEFNNGQVVPSAAYDGTHMDNLTASLKVEETSSTTSRITVTLNNTIAGQVYHTHAHDAADPNTTPNGTPYNETPNTAVYTKMITGNGGTVSVSQDVNMSYSAITGTYDGYLVVHDPLQAVTTVDISTYVIVGTFARTQAASNLASMTFPYAFNTGQVDPNYAYSGSHAATLSGNVKVQALADGTSRISVMLDNTMNGETYHVHSHDMADPNTTPNGTPYNETPNTDVCTMMIMGNGGMAGNTQMSSMSYSDITTMYNGFFVVHDPLQAITTVDPTTYVLLGVFARM